MEDEIINTYGSAAKVQRLLGLNNQQWVILTEKAHDVNKEMLTDKNQAWTDPTRSWTGVRRMEKEGAIRILREYTFHEFRVDIHPAPLKQA